MSEVGHFGTICPQCGNWEAGCCAGRREALTRVSQLEETLRLAAPSVCSLLCPSHWMGDKPPHSEECAKVTTALSTPPTDYLATIKRQAAAEALESVGCTCAISPVNPLFVAHFKWCPLERAAAIRRGE
jgi:hypothetical protein